MGRSDEVFQHFVNGWMRLRAAFSADEAAAMRAAVWNGLAAATSTNAIPLPGPKNVSSIFRTRGAIRRFEPSAVTGVLEAIGASANPM